MKRGDEDLRTRQKKGWIWGVIAALIIISIPGIYQFIKTLVTPDIEEVRATIESYLYEKYGEEFVVEDIGTRVYKDEEEYVARIYPKSIIGTKKEWDSYYYGSASVDRLPFGKLAEPGDDYSYITRNMDMEEYLLPEIKKTFGERVLINVDVAHMVTGDGSWWAGYKSKSLVEMRERIKSNPEKNRIELELYIYIFDRIEDEAEKEERRQQIFDFVQYLKGEGLFEYLELGVIFIDERVLAPSYREYRDKIYSIEEETEVEGEIVYLPPEDFRREMSEVLQKEVEQMSEEEILERIDRVKKRELSHEGIRKYNTHYMSWIISKGMMEVNRKSFFDRVKRNQQLEKYYYNNINDISLSTFSDYIYIKNF